MLEHFKSSRWRNGASSIKLSFNSSTQATLQMSLQQNRHRYAIEEIINIFLLIITQNADGA